MWLIKWMLQLIIAVVIIAVVGYAGIIGVNFLLSGRMTADMEKTANSALQIGIKVSDSQNDFVGNVDNTGEIINNSNTHNLPYLDIRSLELGADENYLYYRVYFWNIIPQTAENIGGDRIKDPGIKVSVRDKNGKEQAVLKTGYGYFGPLGLYILKTSYLTDPTGIESPESARFTKRDYDSRISGGPGTDYITGAFPLGKIGLKPGQISYFSLELQAQSEKNDRVVTDVLLGNGIYPSIITWELGSNFFRINNNYLMR